MNKDGDLSRRCRNGDPEGWRQLIVEFTPLVYRLCVRMLGNSQDAQDMTQEVFVKIHSSFGSFDSTRLLKPWISKITYNTCLRRLGKESRNLAMPSETEGNLDLIQDVSNPNPERVASQQEAENHLRNAVSNLASKDQALLTLRYREGLSDAEVAEATGMPVNTVKTRIFRARKWLRAKLTPILKEV